MTKGKAYSNLKCDPDEALMLRDLFNEVKPGYHMNKKHWNTVHINAGLPDAKIYHFINHSYDLVVSKLPRAKRPPSLP